MNEAINKKIHVEDGHWLWLGSYSTSGCPVIGQGRIPVRRYLVSQKRGRPIPNSFHVSPKCDVPGCVNPACMVVVSKNKVVVASIKRNIELHRAKATAKARSRKTTILDEAKVAAIRASNEPRKVLAERYGVHLTMIYKVQDGTSWRAVGSNPFAALGAR